MVAGTALSLLMGALYLTPFDQVMAKLERTGIRYRRFMDDFVLFAPTRHKLRSAIRRMYEILDALKLAIHPDITIHRQNQQGV